MALEKKVGTGFEGGHSYKSTWSTEGNTLLHNQLLESWGLKGVGTPSSRNMLTLSGTDAYTTNKDGNGVCYYVADNISGVDELKYVLSENNFELVCASKRTFVSNYQTNRSHIRIATDNGTIVGQYGDSGIKWASTIVDPTDVSSTDAWQEYVYSTWHIKCAIGEDSDFPGDPTKHSLYILSTGKAQTINEIIEYKGISQINEISFGYGNNSQLFMYIDDLTIWEDTSDANAKSEIDAIEAGTSSLQPHIRYIAPMADQTVYTTNGTTDDWTANSVDNKTDLTDGSDSTFSEMTDNEGGLITTATDLSGTIAAAGYTVNTVKSLAAVGFKVEDNEDNTFVGSLSSDGTGGVTSKTVNVAKGSATPAYIRFDEADLTTEGITKTTKAATTFKLQ